MTSKIFGTPQMIVPYEWILENVGKQTMTFASKMISFRGEKVFRVGLKNYAKWPLDLPVLFLMAIDLRKIGMRVESVKCGMHGNGIGPAKMEKMIREDMDDEGSLQLFTIKLYEKILGNCTFSFRICIEGTDPGYSYQLCDRLAKDQLWAALKNQKHLVDVELIVKDKIFPAHKAILAARSPVFADKFEKKQPAGRNGLHHIRIDGVEPSSVEKLLYFIYTGEPKGTLEDGELLKLANYYQLTALSSLCQHAVRKIDAALQIASFMKCFNNNAKEFSSSKITPEKETEISFERTTPTFRCSLEFKQKETEQPQCVMQYQNYSIFIAYLTGKSVWDNECDGFYVEQPVIHLSCIKHRSFGLQVEEVYCDMNEENVWLKMESQYFQKKLELLHLTAKSESCLNVDFPVTVDFDIKTVSTIGNYYYEMMDDLWLNDLWLAATNQLLTDVEIFAGTVKVMEAHRIILSARSPVLNLCVNKISSKTGKSIVTFGAEFDVEIVKYFLKFIYIGSLKTTDGVHQLSKLATMYQVETLKNVCQLLDASPPDAEKLTDCLLQL